MDYRNSFEKIAIEHFEAVGDFITAEEIYINHAVNSRDTLRSELERHHYKLFFIDRPISPLDYDDLITEMLIIITSDIGPEYEKTAYQVMLGANIPRKTPLLSYMSTVNRIAFLNRIQPLLYSYLSVAREHVEEVKKYEGDVENLYEQSNYDVLIFKDLYTEYLKSPEFRNKFLPALIHTLKENFIYFYPHENGIYGIVTKY